VILQQRENPIIAISPAPVAQAATLRQEQQSPQVAPAGVQVLLSVSVQPGHLLERQLQHQQLKRL
jgi:hypothetical protein